MLREETRGPVRVVTLARPDKRNAISSEVAVGLAEAIDRASAAPEVRGVVLAAEGKVFAAGGDLTEFETILDAPDGAERVIAMGARLLEAIEGAPIPVVAAVSGHVYGGGCELLLMMDAVVVEEHVEIAFRHARMGLSPAWGGSARLVQRVGPLVATHLLTTARTVGAREALDIGLCNAACPKGKAMAEAEAIVLASASLERDAVAAQKRALRGVKEATFGDAAAREAAVFKSMWGGPLHRAAMSRFAAGSPPASGDRA